MKSKSSRLLLVLVAGLALAAGYGLHVLAEGAPTLKPLFYSGTLEASGKLASGDHTITLTFFDAEMAGNAVCKSETVNAPVTAGRFRVEVSAECVAALKNQPDVWVGLKFAGPDGVPHEIPLRTKIGAVPFAMEAQHAVSASSAASAAGTLAATLQSVAQRLTTLEQPQTHFYEGAFATPTAWEADLIYNKNYKRFCDALGKQYVSASELVHHYHSSRANGYFYKDWYYVGPRFCADDTGVYDAADPANPYSVWKYNGNCGCCVPSTNWTIEVRALITCK